jgi:hypothetical protein
MGLDSPIRLTQMDKHRHKEDRVGMQIANPNLIIQEQPLKERMDRNPKTPLEEVFEDNDLTRLRVGVAVTDRKPPSSELPVMEHPRGDELVDITVGGLRHPPLLPHRRRL